jgi:hypothetical protein
MKPLALDVVIETLAAAAEVPDPVLALPSNGAFVLAPLMPNATIAWLLIELLEVTVILTVPLLDFIA